MSGTIGKLIVRQSPSGAELEPGAVGDVLTVNADGSTASFKPSSASAPVTSVFSRVGAILAALNDYVASLIGNDSGTGGATVKDALNILKAPFRGSYFVDATFVGTSTGSSTNPYTTFAAAFAAVTALGIGNAIYYLPANANHAENVVFPTTGTHEIASQTQWGYLFATITGTIDLSTTATARRALTNLNVTGNVTGNAVGGASRLLITTCQLGGTLALTATGGASWRCGLKGTVSDGGAVGFGGFVSGAASVAGVFYTTNWTFVSTVTLSGVGGGPGGVFSDTLFSIVGGAALTTTGAGAVSVVMHDCLFSGLLTLTASSGSMVLKPDGPTMSAMMASGGVATVGAVTVTGTLGNIPARATVANNVGATSLGGAYPLSLAVCEATLTLLVPGTAGAAVLNVIYTDLNGVLQTKAVTTALNVAGAAGDEVRGAFQFSQNGATPVQFSVTGIVTPGALLYSYGAAVRQAS